MYPKLFQCLKTYNKHKLMKDVIAGIIVGIIALPLSIALAIASGVSPEKGLITAIIGGFITSFLGGSRFQISGPTGAFVVIVLGIIHEYGLDGLIAATFLAGFILILMGLFKMGDLIKFIPYPITTGFTCGIAITIFSTQIQDFLGLQMDKTPPEFLEKLPSEFLIKWGNYLYHMNTTNLYALGLGILTILIILFWPKVNKKIPGTLIAILVTTAIALIFKLDVPTIGSKFQEIKGSIPAPRLPQGLSIEMIQGLIGPAFAIAFLGSIESLLSAVVADGMTGRTHFSNMELVGQGVANIGSALFGGIPVTGAIARTAANIKNGGLTPISGIVHSISLLIMMIFLMPYVKYIPMTALAGILIIVAYNMGEWEYFKTLRIAPKSDSAVFLVTFLLTVLFDLVFAIEVGMVLAALLFMKRMADLASFKLNPGLDEVDLDTGIKYDHHQITVYEIKGAFFFGAADNFIKTYKSLEKAPKVLILVLNQVPHVDSTAYLALERLHKLCKAQKTEIFVVGLQSKTYEVLDKFGFFNVVPKKNLFAKLEDAIVESNSYVKQKSSHLTKDVV